MWPDWLIAALVIGGLIGFAALLISVAWADRKAKRDVAEGREPGFSWAWLILSLLFLARGADLFIKECINQRHQDAGSFANLTWQGLAILLLAVGITAFVNQIKWLIYTRRNKQ